MEFGIPQAVLLVFMSLTLVSGIVLGPEKVIPKALVLALFFLPPYSSLVIPGPIPEISKLGTVCYPALVLFLVSGKQFKKIRWNFIDLMAAIFLGSLVFSNFAAGKSLYSIGSRTLSLLTEYLVPYFAGRIWLGERKRLLDWAKFLFMVALLYVPMMAMEFPLSPFWANSVYRLDTVYVQSYRYGFFRPFVFFYTTLELGAYLGLVLGLAVGYKIWLKRERKPVPLILNLQILAYVFGIMLTMSRGPIIGAIIILGGFFVFHKRSWMFSWLLGVFGVCLFLWMVFNASAWKVGDFLSLGSGEMESTLAYRLMEVDVYSAFVTQRPILGWGVPFPRDFWVPIIDGLLLILIMEGGVLGMGSYVIWLLSMIKRIVGKWKDKVQVETLFGTMLGLQLGWLLFSAWGDAFISPFHLFLCGSIVTLHSRRVTTEPSVVRVMHAEHRSLRSHQGVYQGTGSF